MQHQRYVLLVFAVGSLLLGVTFNAGITSLFDTYSDSFEDFLLGGLVNLSTVLTGLLTVGTFMGLLRSRAAITYIDEVVDELLKVTWPSREETLQAATTVVVTTLLVAGLVGIYDLIWKNVADIFLYSS